MDDCTTGIILRTRLLTETSLIVHWITPDLGRVATVARGARRPKSPFRGKLDLFYQAQLSLLRSRRSDLHTLREVRLLESHPNLRRDLQRLRQAAYGAALIEQTTETDTPIPGLYQLFQQWLSCLNTLPPCPERVFAFELALLHELGLAPDLAQSRLRPETRAALGQLAAGTDALAAADPLPPEPRSEIRAFLHGFLIFHLGRIPPSRHEALGPG